MKSNRKTGKSLSRTNQRRRPISTYELFEPRQLLASVGWDGPGQGSAELTYYVGDAPTGISQAEFESTIEDALQVWADHIYVTFTQTSRPNQPDSLDFTSLPIDGAVGVLARAYFPDDLNRGSIAGDVQFDTSDQWEVGNDQGFRATDLMYVAVHEIGHSLGLEHIDDHDSVLSHSVSRNQAFESLSHHDIDAAMALYAPANPAQLTPTAEEPTTGVHSGHADHRHPTENPVAHDPHTAPDAQPTDPIPDSDHSPDHDHDHDDDSDTNGDHNLDQENRRRRFWRIIDQFARRFRFSFWNRVAFLRW